MDSATTLSRLRALAALLPDLEQPGFELGRWAGGERQPDGAITVPYFEFSDRGQELVAALPVIVFAWPEWLQSEEGQALATDRGRLARATPEQIVKLTTAIVRSERFSDGSIAGAFESGLLTAIVRRAAELTAG